MESRGDDFGILRKVAKCITSNEGIHSYMDGMRKSGEAYYENNNLQDLWLTGENFSDDDLKEIKNIENVKDAERLLTIETDLLDFKNVSIETNFIESNNISKMYIVEGEKFDKNNIILNN